MRRLVIGIDYFLSWKLGVEGENESNAMFALGKEKKTARW